LGQEWRNRHPRDSAAVCLGSPKVRNLLDSLDQGFPVGYLIAWRNPTVKLKDGTTSAGKRILIDGQQRVTALMASLLGMEVLTKDHERVRIRIAFNPLATDDEPSFEVSNPAIAKNPAWIPDVSKLFQVDADLFEQTDAYVARNPEIDRKPVGQSLQRLLKVVNNSVGLIELAEDLDIETVTEIFIRVNSAGAELSQADFAMSKIAVNETYGGNTLRKAIEYFYHLAVSPDFYSQIEKNDPEFARSEFLLKMAWLKDVMMISTILPIPICCGLRSRRNLVEASCRISWLCSQAEILPASNMRRAALQRPSKSSRKGCLLS
jgi:hypothetical protein